MIYLNGTPLNVTLFPDNTSQVWKLNQISYQSECKCGECSATVSWEFSNEAEFMHLAQLKMLLDKLAIPARLSLKYLPYGRQDKEVKDDTTFALRTFAKLLNSLHFEEVTIQDPHSNIALDLINNSRAIYPIFKIEKILGILDASTICYPDKGAVEKYSKIYPWVYLYGNKVRDQATGYISSYHIASDSIQTMKIVGQKVLIIDDICDGGMTFVLLAKALFDHGASEVNLFVTHGIFSKGLKPLKEAGINRIFTQDGEASEVQNHITYRRL
jgi:ribose-phosphate pyrophosphokinase